MEITDYECVKTYISYRNMRKISQFVALLVILLFAGQAAFADTPCSQWLHAGDGHGASCCVAAPSATGDRLTADCRASMPAGPAASEYNPCGCYAASVPVAAQAIMPAKSGVQGAATLDRKSVV